MTQNGGIEVSQVIGHMKKKGSFKIVIIGFALGLCLLLLGSFVFKDEDGNSSASENATTVGFEEYKRSIVAEIESLCLGIEGVKSVKATVFFDGVGESIYAQNSQIGNTNKVEYVIIGSGSNSHALYLGESLPTLSGVGVVCDTGGNDSLKNEISLLLSSLYGLPLTRVYVGEG